MEESNNKDMKFIRIDKDGNEIGIYERNLGDDIKEGVQRIGNTIYNDILPFTEKVIDTVSATSPVIVEKNLTDLGNMVGGVITKDPKRVCNAARSFAERKIKCAANFAKVVYGASKTGTCCIAKKDLTPNDVKKLKEYGVILSSAALTIAITGEVLHELHTKQQEI